MFAMRSGGDLGRLLGHSGAIWAKMGHFLKKRVKVGFFAKTRFCARILMSIFEIGGFLGQNTVNR